MNFMVSLLWFGVGAAADDASLGRDAAPAAVRLTQSYHSKFFLSYSPDGARLTFTRHYANRRAAQQVLMGLWMVDADGSNERRLLEAHDREVQIQEHAAWSPDGRRIAVTGGGNDTGNAAKDTFVCGVEPGGATGLRKLVPGAGVNVGEQAAKLVARRKKPRGHEHQRDALADRRRRQEPPQAHATARHICDATCFRHGNTEAQRTQRNA